MTVADARFKGAFLIMACLLLHATSATAAGDVQNGRQTAHRWCAACHVVSPEQTAAAADVPSFQSIARREDFTEALLTAFLSTSHPRMPDMSLSRSEISDLIAYIRSLR